MEIITIDKDDLQKKKVKKLIFGRDELPKTQLFNSEDVISGNPGSNIAIGFIYTWKEDSPPPEILSLFQRLSNYAALTGLWRTTNGGRYVFSNILANPNINKLVLLVFGAIDNGHLLVHTAENLWKYGCDSDGIVKNCKAANPKFEQVTQEGLERIRKQADLITVRKIKHDFDRIEKLIRALIQEPKNAIPTSEFNDLTLKFISNIPELAKAEVLYDDGARFESPLHIDLTSSARKVEFVEQLLIPSIGGSIHAKNLEEGLKQVASFVYTNGSASVDMRKLKMIECRSLSITILDPLEKIPEDFSKAYIDQYVEEFMRGVNTESEFTYNYHERIFRRWGDQVSKAICLLKDNPNTRRAVISLWDQSLDIDSTTPPCLDMIWLCVRDRKLELHATYRSHHLATVTQAGKLMKGEGAFVPNAYALGVLQKHVADILDRDCGPLVINDGSGHIHITEV